MADIIFLTYIAGCFLSIFGTALVLGIKGSDESDVIFCMALAIFCCWLWPIAAPTWGAWALGKSYNENRNRNRRRSWEVR